MIGYVVTLGSTTPLFETIGPYGSDYGFVQQEFVVD
jgi:hypothetical protein